MEAEMKKVIPIPEGTERIEVYSYASVDEKGTDYPIGSSLYDVKDLPDASTVAKNATVEKRVIELPVDLLEKLTVEKENASGLLGFFDMDGHSAEIMNWLGEFLPEPDNLEPENIAADWYLDHVKFVPKKEPKYRYRMTGFDNPYITSDKEGGLFLTAVSIQNQQLFTRREIEKQASEQGFKLSAFKEIEVEE